MIKYVKLFMVIAAVAALCLSCSSKKKVVTGTQYKCKECGKVYRDDTREMEVDRDLAEQLGVEVVDGYCPKCGVEIVTVEQVQNQKCPACFADRGAVTKIIKIERKFADTVPGEIEVAVTCPTGKCARVGRLHEQYNWDWEFCRAIVDEKIGLGFNEEMVREAWGPPKRVEKIGSAKKWYYDTGNVTIGASGKVVDIKQ